jgi:hypothetical protein
MYAKSWQNVREKSAKMSVTNWQKFLQIKKMAKCPRKTGITSSKNGKNVRERICEMSVRNRPNGRDKSTKFSAKNRQKCPRKIGKNVREKIGKNVGDKLAKMFAKITRENVQNLQNHCLQNYF